MSFEDKLISGLQALMFIWGWILLLFAGAFIMWLYERFTKKRINATDIFMPGTFLDRAYFCIEEGCEAIFERPNNSCCPVCASQSIFPLKKFLPSLEMKGNEFRLKLSMGDYKELEELVRNQPPGKILSLSG